MLIWHYIFLSCVQISCVHQSRNYFTLRRFIELPIVRFSARFITFSSWKINVFQKTFCENNFHFINMSTLPQIKLATPTIVKRHWQQDLRKNIRHKKTLIYFEKRQSFRWRLRKLARKDPSNTKCSQTVPDTQTRTYYCENNPKTTIDYSKLRILHFQLWKLYSILLTVLFCDVRSKYETE